MKSLIIGLISLFIIIACSSLNNVGLSPTKKLKARDFYYLNVPGDKHLQATEVMDKNNSWFNSVVAVKYNNGVYASGVCISSNKEYSWVVTAYHVIVFSDKNTEVLYTFVDKEGFTRYTTFTVAEVFSAKNRDFAVLKVNGKLPYAVSPHKGYRPLGNYDITVGYQGRGITDKVIYEGYARSGQSGGGVFSDTHGLFGIVSTTDQGVYIWPNLVDMGLSHIVP